MNLEDIAKVRDSELLSKPLLKERFSLSIKQLSDLYSLFPLSAKVKQQIQLAANRKSLPSREASLKAKNAGSKKDRILAELNTVQRGYAAEALFVYRAILAGVDVILPSRSMAACDAIVRCTNGKFISVEIKGTVSDSVSFCRTSHVRGKESYSEEDHIDFLVAVDLIRENVFVLPFCESVGSTYSVLDRGFLCQYSNRFDLLV